MAMAAAVQMGLFVLILISEGGNRALQILAVILHSE